MSSEERDELDRLYAQAVATLEPPFKVTPAMEGAVFELGGGR